MTTQKKKRKNPADLTLRNLRASATRIGHLELRTRLLKKDVLDLHQLLFKAVVRLARLEQRAK